MRVYLPDKPHGKENVKAIVESVGKQITEHGFEHLWTDNEKIRGMTISVRIYANEVPVIEYNTEAYVDA